jgi:hypothetical protein
LIVTLPITVFRAMPRQTGEAGARRSTGRALVSAFTAAEVMLTMRRICAPSAVHRRLDQFDRRQHVGVDRLDPVVTGPVAKSPGGEYRHC